jgi:hypothetical protein
VIEDPTHLPWIDDERRYERRDPKPFDRVAFAMRTLDVLRPRRLTVAVYPSAARSMRVERGRDLSTKADSWAIVGIPADASRENIALALVELAGLSDSKFLVDLLIAQAVRLDA